MSDLTLVPTSATAFLPLVNEREARLSLPWYEVRKQGEDRPPHAHLLDLAVRMSRTVIAHLRETHAT